MRAGTVTIMARVLGHTTANDVVSGICEAQAEERALGIWIWIRARPGTARSRREAWLVDGRSLIIKLIQATEASTALGGMDYRGESSGGRGVGKIKVKRKKMNETMGGVSVCQRVPVSIQGCRVCCPMTGWIPTPETDKQQQKRPPDA